jgi:hypothetical protein
MTCLEHHGVDATIKFFEELGGKTSAGAAVGLGTVSTASSRRGAYRMVCRSAMRDPVSWLLALKEAGLPRVAAWLRQLPHLAPGERGKLLAYLEVHQARRLLQWITRHFKAADFRIDAASDNQSALQKRVQSDTGRSSS